MNLLIINWINTLGGVVFGFALVLLLLVLLVLILKKYGKITIILQSTDAQAAQPAQPAVVVAQPQAQPQSYVKQEVVKQEEVHIAEEKPVQVNVPAKKEVVTSDGEISPETSAAIAMALHLFYAEVHDVESAIITIKTVERRYSPWSSKIYGLNNLVR
jgi:predicted lipid-binding transport protein (Tim44 family)